jgi:hypothetical protein
MELIYYIYLPVVKICCVTEGGDYRFKKWYIFIMTGNNTICSDDPAFQHLQCRDINVSEGIILEGHIFLVSLLPCCAQLALPYWAKITGRIINNNFEEMLLTIVVTVLDNDGLALADYTDVMALDGGQKGEFEVKLVEHFEMAKTYALTIKETDQL